ncbi:uncharacterized protein LOC110211875 [Phascolarctos cinereus]|uniref:Uncharacterized protein LOC110211875 n=1 Tax=Phascolarctos cinereus TaxID=38626 RepID=A0A6P5KSU2_PHACI|nr:uncharacterized protein LOC110211875 [Phascolarctos cinereus]
MGQMQSALLGVSTQFCECHRSMGILILPTSGQKELGGGWGIKRWGYLRGETRCVPPPTEGAPSLSGCGGLRVIPRNSILSEGPWEARGRDSCISRSGPLGSLPAPRILLLLPPQSEPEPEQEPGIAPRSPAPRPSTATPSRPWLSSATRGGTLTPCRRQEGEWRSAPRLSWGSAQVSPAPGNLHGFSLGGKHYQVRVKHVTTFRLTVKASLDNPTSPITSSSELDDAKHPGQLPEGHFTA